jgi:hypothetical protein
MPNDFPEEVKLTIANRANLTCSNPACGATTRGPQIDPSKALNIGVAACISSAARGRPRYDEMLTPEQRASAWNGVWLCQTCANLIDTDEAAYPEEVVRAWKTLREHEVKRAMAKANPSTPETESQKKQRAIAEWIGKRVMLVKMPTERERESLGERPWSPNRVTVKDCNRVNVVVEFAAAFGKPGERTIPLANIKIGFDSNYKCMELLEHP